MRYVNPTKDDVKRNAGLLGSHLRYNKSKNSKISKAYDSTMNRHFDGRRKGILDKAGAEDTGYVTSGLKRGTYARDDADYKLTGRDRVADDEFLGSRRRGSARVDQAHAYEQARNRGMTDTQARRASAGVEKSRLQSSSGKGRQTPRQQAAKDRAGRKSFVEQQKSVGTMKNMIGKAKGKALSKGAKLPVKASTKVKNKLVAKKIKK